MSANKGHTVHQVALCVSCRHYVLEALLGISDFHLKTRSIGIKTAFLARPPWCMPVLVTFSSRLVSFVSAHGGHTMSSELVGLCQHRTCAHAWFTYMFDTR